MELASEIPPLLLLPYLHDWVEQARAPGPDRARTSSGGCGGGSPARAQCAVFLAQRPVCRWVVPPGRLHRSIVVCSVLPACPTVSRGPQGYKLAYVGAFVVHCFCAVDRL